MPKLSVYVADELWEQAKRLAGSGGAKVNNSQLVQRALDQMVSDRRAERAAFREGSRAHDDRLAEVVAGLRESARRDYEDGYGAVLDLVAVFDYGDLRMVTNWPSVVGEGTMLDAAIELGSHGVGGEGVEAWFDQHKPFQMEDGSGPSEPWRAGAQRAFDDVWQALRADSWGAAPANDGHDDETEAGGEE